MVMAEYVRYMNEMICKYIPDEVYDYLPESVITRTLLIGAATGFLAYLIFRKRYHLPPGPRSLPFIGNRIFFTDKHLPKELFDMSKKYGPVFSLKLGPTLCVVLNSIDGINEALLKKGAHFSDRFSFYTADQMIHNSEDIVFSKFGTAWKLRRKIASRAIRIFMTRGDLNSKIEAAVSKTVAEMLKEKGPFDPKPYLLFTTLNIIAAMCFGKSYEYDDPEYWDLLTNLEENSKIQSDGLIFENAISIFAGIFTTARYKQMDIIIKKFMLLIERYVTAHRKNFVPGQVNDLTDSLLQAEREITEEGQDNMADFQPIHVILIVFDIFIAGNDTSRGTLNFALLYITGVPGVQQKIQEEVYAAVGRERFPTTADRNNLPYTDAVLHEAMRMGPVVPLGVPHRTSCDSTLGEYDIPKNTTVFINHWALHQDPNNWPEVDKFKPERFLDEEGKMAPKPENWLPFSAGRRVCLGEPLAKAELHLILAALFQQLEILPEPGKPIEWEHDAKGFTFSPKPYKVIVKKRI